MVLKRKCSGQTIHASGETLSLCFSFKPDAPLFSASLLSSSHPVLSFFPAILFTFFSFAFSLRFYVTSFRPFSSFSLVFWFSFKAYNSLNSSFSPATFNFSNNLNAFVFWIQPSSHQPLLDVFPFFFTGWMSVCSHACKPHENLFQYLTKHLVHTKLKRPIRYLSWPISRGAIQRINIAWAIPRSAIFPRV